MKARTIACALAFALLGGAASAQDTVKLAIGQRGNWTRRYPRSASAPASSRSTG